LENANFPDKKNPKIFPGPFGPDLSPTVLNLPTYPGFLIFQETLQLTRTKCNVGEKAAICDA